MMSTLYSRRVVWSSISVANCRLLKPPPRKKCFTGKVLARFSWNSVEGVACAKEELITFWSGIRIRLTNKQFLAFERLLVQDGFHMYGSWRISLFSSCTKQCFSWANQVPIIPLIQLQYELNTIEFTVFLLWLVFGEADVPLRLCRSFCWQAGIFLGLC